MKQQVEWVIGVSGRPSVQLTITDRFVTFYRSMRFRIHDFLYELVRVEWS
jgi:hypothetical protein